MLLRLIPKEHFSLKFDKTLDLNTSIFNGLQYIGFDGNTYHFINNATSNFTAKFKFTDDSELVIPIEVYNRQWQICSPFELTITQLEDNASLSVVNWYNDYFFRYSTSGNVIVFANQTDVLFRIVVGGQQCVFEHLDQFNNSISTIYVNDTRSKISFILKPNEKLYVTTKQSVIFRTEKEVQ